MMPAQLDHLDKMLLGEEQHQLQDVKNGGSNVAHGSITRVTGAPETATETSVAADPGVCSHFESYLR